MAGPTLPTFAAEARERVDTGYYDSAPRATGRPPSLVEAIRRAPNKPAIIAEIKPASPTLGTMRRHVDAEKLAHDFVTAGATAISALAEPARFGGSLDNVRRATNAGAPVLFKDFIVDTRQIDAAHACGASAVLLILDLHDTAATCTLEEAIAHAHARHMEILLEVYDQDGAQRAHKTEADIIGVNNRDLRAAGLPIEPTRAATVLRDTPRDRPVMALSGIDSPAGIQHARDAHIDAVLIGSTLMRATDPAAQLRRLQQRGTNHSP